MSINQEFAAVNKLNIERSENVVKVTQSGPDNPDFEIVLPSELALDMNAVSQLADFANVQTVSGKHVVKACATPDFHKGSTVPVGAVVATDSDWVIPKAVGTDINCGMRVHQWDMTIEEFLPQKKEWLKLLHGDLLEGTRNMPGNRMQMEALARDGLFGWLTELRKSPTNMWSKMDWDMHFKDIDQCYSYGWMQGDPKYLPEALKRDGVFRDPSFATIGSGNHFLEIGYVAEVYDRKTAYEWGLVKNKMTIMIHTGSRDVGFHVGGRWMDYAKSMHPKGLPHPESGIYALEGADAVEYLKAMSVAANYAYANRLALAELVRQRCVQVYGERSLKMVSDIPHNIVIQENGLNVHRKGSTPAMDGDRLIIPGSMGDSSYILRGMGNERFLNTASHGAGRAVRRQQMYHTDIEAREIECITLKEERKIEEAPSAYKPIGPVIDSQVSMGMVGKVARIEPVLTFKA